MIHMTYKIDWSFSDPANVKWKFERKIHATFWPFQRLKFILNSMDQQKL